jgi:hypothetical protein
MNIPPIFQQPGPALVLALLFALPATASAQLASQTFNVTAPGVSPAVVADIEADLAWAESRIAERLGPFPDTVSVRIFADRAGFTEALREAWGIPETACWMVGAADDYHLYLLSHDAWREEACEHDPDDSEHRRLLVTHEAVHVYHGQVNPSDDIGLLEEIGWFVEGLATWASGQLEAAHAGRAAEALEAGEGPALLAEAWSGQYRYGVAGSLVAWIDENRGREVLLAALEFTTWDEFESLLGMSEDEFLAAWRLWVEDS